MQKKIQYGNKHLFKVKNHSHFSKKYMGVTDSVFNKRHTKVRKIPVVLHIRSNYNDYLIIKQLANTNEFFGNSFKCLGENLKKSIRV